MKERGITVTGIVLAGGASRRMGRDKAWVKLDGKPLVAYVIDALRHVCAEIIVVTNRAGGYEGLGVRVTPDVFPNTGSLGGIYSGLRAARNLNAVAVACDMPFLNPELLNYIVSEASGFDVVIPSVHTEREAKEQIQKQDAARPRTAKDSSLHPLHAVYSQTCLGAIEQGIARGDLRMIGFHDALRVRVVPEAQIDAFDPQHLSFFNVNTPEALRRAEEVVTQEKAMAARKRSARAE